MKPVSKSGTAVAAPGVAAELPSAAVGAVSRDKQPGPQTARERSSERQLIAAKARPDAVCKAEQTELADDLKKCIIDELEHKFLWEAALERNLVRKENGSDVQRIKDTLSEQVAAWNAGDIDGFMAYYKNNDTTTFVSGQKLNKGWANVKASYIQRYKMGPEKKSMGHLSFVEIDVRLIGGPNVALAHGVFQLAQQPEEAEAAHREPETASVMGRTEAQRGLAASAAEVIAQGRFSLVLEKKQQGAGGGRGGAGVAAPPPEGSAVGVAGCGGGAVAGAGGSGGWLIVHDHTS